MEIDFILNPLRPPYMNEAGEKVFHCEGSSDFLMKKFDEFGAQGWELITAANWCYIFKRAI
jgi:hypothetical protein